MASVADINMPARPTPSPATRAHEEARLQLLASLPVRLEPGKLGSVIELHDAGKGIRTIARLIHIDAIVVELEVQRELQRRESGTSPPGAQTSPRPESFATLTAREMNRLARGTHIPNRQLRALVDSAIRLNPGLTLNSVLRSAGFSDNSQGRRVLGYVPHSGCPRPSETIRPSYAARIARAIRRAPVEVVGL
jgi:hypothetical protein